MKPYMRPVWAGAEAAGTALLVAIGLSIVIVATLFPAGPLRRAITGGCFGLVGTLITISPLGRISGAHINPAITVAFALTRHFPGREAGAYVLDHITNLGQGAALQTGITYALRKGAEFVCTFDADGQHSPHAIDDLLEALVSARADVALGSRFLRGGSAVPSNRRMLLKAALLFTRLHARVAVTDTHNGLRAFTRRAAQSIEIEQPGMAHASEILQKLGALGLRVVEVPVQIAYTPYSKRKGQSGFDSIKILLDLLYRSIDLRS